MEEVVASRNVKAALKRVRQNRGSPGIDGMKVDELPEHLMENWESLKAQLLDGTYHPQPVREQEIPKSGGGVRKLGIPTAVDRLVQQAILQVLQPRFDPTFSESSHYGPGSEVRRRVAPKALEKLKERVREMTARNGGRSIGTVVQELRGFLNGWKAYFRLTQATGVLADLDQWIRRKLRILQLKQWKRGTTAYRELRKLGAAGDVAARVAKYLRRWWRNSGMLLNTVLTTRYYDREGLPRLSC